MARKSKRIALTDIKPSEQSNVYNVAVYLRLSIEEKRDNKESESIEYQREIVFDYIKDRPDLKIHAVYCDNGETGTNFEREDFQRMMYDVYNGNVNCIIVKDLSRFGREYIEAGDYLERIFPLIGVRFIAVNDHYDNNVSAFDISVPIKNIINTMYAKDLSKKSAAALRIKQINGEYIGGPAMYGYLRSEEQKNALVVDEEAASVVRMIFEWKADGMSNMGICRKLYDLKISPPAKYKYDKGIVKNEKYSKCEFWQERTIAMMVANQTYIGNMVQGKTKSHFYEGGNCEKVDRDNWVVVEGTHKPIISKELFDKVQIIVNKKRTEYLDTHSKKSNNNISVLKGKVFCGECGSPAKYTRNASNPNKIKYYYRCRKHFEFPEQCSFIAINEDVLKNVVLQSVKMQLSFLMDIDTALNKHLNMPSTKKKMTALTKNTSDVLANISYIKTSRIKLTTDYARQIISDDEYTALKSELDLELNKEAYKLGELNKQRDKFNRLMSAGKWIAEFKKYSKLKKLNIEIVNSFVEKIKLYSDKRVEIEWVFAPIISELKAFFEGGTQGAE